VIDGLDPEELARRVVDLLRDRPLRIRLGERARRRAVRFSSTRAAAPYAARPAEVVGHQGSSAARQAPNSATDARTGLPLSPNIYYMLLILPQAWIARALRVL